MDGIQIVVVLVRCAAKLLFCDIDLTGNLRFATIDECRSEAIAMLAVRQASPGSGIWMSRCRYRLTRPETRQAQSTPVSPDLSAAIAGGVKR